MTKKNFLTLLLCVLLSFCFTVSSYAEANIIYQSPLELQTAYVKFYADVKSGRTEKGFYYGFERLTHLREIIHGEPVTITSTTKLSDTQYQITCESANRYSNGTFIIDLFPGNQNELKEGYQIWFSLFDEEGRKYYSAQVKRAK